MKNHFFQFKQFRIDQESCGMKVSTDACIQGAWTPVSSSVERILDIGTGTGLLSLMLAQRNKNALIHAVEIEPSAGIQANKNFEDSLWSERLFLQTGDVRRTIFREKFDLIICNPPFFLNSLQSPDLLRNRARHAVSLNLEELFEVIQKNIADNGKASVLLPAQEFKEWEKTVRKNRWHFSGILNIIPVDGQKPNRIVSLCGANTFKETSEEDLIIRYRTGDYTPEFIHLLRPFYLKF